MAIYDDYQTRSDTRGSENRYGREERYGRRDGFGGARGRDFGGQQARRSDTSGRDDRGSDGRNAGSNRGFDRAGRDNDRFYNHDEDRRVAINETERLIASNKVEGTRVYNRQGERLGTVENFMVDKRSGRVEYAVLSFGGFLGLGERHYPLPWNMLDYDTEQGGYVVDLNMDELERAPSFAPGAEHRFGGGYDTHVDRYYGVF